MYYWSPQKIKELKSRGFKFKYYNYDSRMKKYSIEEIEEMDAKKNLTKNKKYGNGINNEKLQSKISRDGDRGSSNNPIRVRTNNRKNRK
jgi:hypothetical protein